MTEAEALQVIERAKTPRGAWTRAQLNAWGVEWPPERGWKHRILARIRETGESICVHDKQIALF